MTWQRCLGKPLLLGERCRTKGSFHSEPIETTDTSRLAVYREGETGFVRHNVIQDNTCISHSNIWENLNSLKIQYMDEEMPVLRVST